ncbi:MAG: alpha/beta hydrolase [Candidatus Kariarchaeaceae archaeon]
MHKYILLTLSLTLIFVGCDKDSGTEPPYEITTGRIETVVIHSQALEGNLLGDSPDRSVSIYLPTVYDENTNIRLPVIYLLHGYTQNNVSFLSFFSLKSVFDSFFEESTVQPMIIVIPNADNAYNGSFYTNSIVTGDWEDFITQELVEYIDNNYRTIQQASGRGISGYSMGGYGTIMLAMKHPDIFSATYSLSGTNLIFEDVILVGLHDYLIQAVNATQFSGLPMEAQAMIAEGVAFAPNVNSTPFMCDFPVDTNGVVIDSLWQRWLENDPYSLIETYRNNLLQLNGIKFDCGTQDALMESTRKFHMALDTKGIPHYFEEHSGNHTNKIRDRVRSSMLSFFSGILTGTESDYPLLSEENSNTRR